jgi:uncharacterized membrane protein
MTSERYFTEADQKRITAAIVEAEQMTSGEIRVHIENYCDIEPYQRAKEVFDLLNMEKTASRNGVIIYIALSDRRMAIYGDKAIHELVGNDYWVSTLDLMKTHFVKNNFTEGIIQAILSVGDQLKSNFPYLSDDKNELPNEISFG